MKNISLLNNTKISSTLKLLQNQYYYHWTKNLIYLKYLRTNFLQSSFNALENECIVLKRFSSTTTITQDHEMIKVNPKDSNDNYHLTTFNDEEFLWRLRLFLLTKKDSEDFWKLLRVYMYNNVKILKSQPQPQHQASSLSMIDIERIFIRLFQKNKLTNLNLSRWFRKMLQRSRITLNSNCYNIILKNCASNEHLINQDQKIFMEMKNLGLTPTRLTLQQLIRDYSNLGKMNHVKRWFNILLDLGYKPTRETYIYLIRGSILINDIGSINHNLREMVELNHKPLKVHVDEFIKRCALNDRSQDLKWAFDRFFVKGDWNATSDTYNWMLLSCSKRRDEHLASIYFDEMIKRKNLKPNVLTFQHLITMKIGSCEFGFPGPEANPSKSLNEAMRLYKKMRQEFLIKPNMYICFILIRRLIYSGENDKLSTYIKVLPELSYELLTKLQFNNNPTISMKVSNKFLRQLFTTFLKYGYLEAARNVYKTMRKRNYNFAIETGSLNLIESFASKGNYFSALQIFHEMISNGVRPHPYHLNLLLRGYFQNNDFKGGLEFYNLIESHQLIPSKDIYHIVNKVLVDIKDIQQVREICQKLIRYHEIPNLDTLKMLIKFGEIEEVRRIVENMPSYGLKLDLTIYNDLLEKFKNADSFTLNDVKRIYQRVLDENIEPDGITYKNLLLVHIKDKDLKGGLEVFEKIFLENKPIHFHGAISLIRALIDSDRDDAMEKCLDIYEKLKMRAVIKEPLFNSMLYGAKKFGKMKLYDKISQEKSKNKIHRK
ncbi:8994_t:CDS:1 [Funneliformis geosporum]|uniref:15880_t:CDS:1 n=1 Tax=Funneliformis geosporum TaxID=1117311 RepID=A0A9W4SR37_9GLOM|nr:8994_t:CDS:1 [Funneliformis geosporum]CAI2179703.1 15880_t:CDS:1 [Funneliformis geosporum]